MLHTVRSNETSPPLKKALILLIVACAKDCGLCFAWEIDESDNSRRCFVCRVLQGHVALAGAVFPAGTPGLMLEMLARGPLWQDGLNYQHGTGHGMGAYLNVHEGPMGIGTFQIFTEQLIISSLIDDSDNPSICKRLDFKRRCAQVVARSPRRRSGATRG